MLCKLSPTLLSLIRLCNSFFESTESSPFFSEQDEDAVEEIPDRIPELRIVEFLETLPRKIPIASHGNFMGEEEAEGIGIPFALFENIFGNNDIPDRFTHLLSIDIQESVNEETIGCAHSCSLQHRRPDQRMKAGDIFADDMRDLCLVPPHFAQQRSVPREARRAKWGIVLAGLRVASHLTSTCSKIIKTGNVIRQRIAPDVHHLPFISRYRYTPRQARFRARERDIFESLCNECERFLCTEVGSDCVGSLKQGFKPARFFLEQEEPVFLLYFFRHREVIRAFSFHKFLLREEFLASCAVETGVRPLLEEFLLLQLFPESNDCRPVLLPITRADEEIRRDTEFPVEILKQLHISI